MKRVLLSAIAFGMVCSLTDVAFGRQGRRMHQRHRSCCVVSVTPSYCAFNSPPPEFPIVTQSPVISDAITIETGTDKTNASHKNELSTEDMAQLKADVQKELENSGELQKIKDNAQKDAADALTPEELAKIKADALKELEDSGELQKIKDEAKAAVEKNP